MSHGNPAHVFPAHPATQFGTCTDAELESIAALEHEVGSSYDVEKIRLERARSYARGWVIRRSTEDEGRIPEGRCVILSWLLTWHVADELHILQLATAVAARRQGHGQRLLETAMQYAREHAIGSLLLEVRVGNVAALTLYRKLGFFGQNLRRAYYDDGEDGLDMRLILGPDGQAERRPDDL